MRAALLLGALLLGGPSGHPGSAAGNAGAPQPGTPHPGVPQAAAPLPGAASERVFRLVARRFSYAPDTLTLEVGVPSVIELTTEDRVHGFNVPGLDLRADIEPGKTTRVRVLPERTGTFPFHCDLFCGSGHEEMEGRIVVVPRKETAR